MLTHFYSWYLTYLGTKNLPMTLQTLLQSSYSNVQGFNIINADVVSGNNIHKNIQVSSFPAGSLVLYATILDSISAMSSALIHLKGTGFPKIGFYSYTDFVSSFDIWKAAADFKTTVRWITTPGVMSPTNSGRFCRAVYFKIYGTRYGKGFLQLASATSRHYQGPIVVSPTAEAEKILPAKKMPLFSRDPIRIVTRADPPFIFTYLDANGVTRINETYGMLKDYMDAYAKHLGFTYEFYLVADGEMGHYHAEKGWNGMVGDIIVGKADMAGGAFSIDVNRSRVIDYTEATIPWTLSLLMKAPQVERTIWQFLKPFDTYLWLLILGVLFVMSFLLTLLTWIDYTTETINLSDSFYHIAAILTQGSSETNPTSIPSRIMIAFVMFFAIVFNASYTANMTAFLTLRNEDASIKTLDVLSTQGKVKYGVVDGSEAMNLLKKMTTNPALLLWSTITREKDVRILPSYEAAVEKIKVGDFILISESVISSYYVNIDCELVAVSQPSFTIRYALGVPLGLPVKRRLDEAITKVREDDQDSKIKTKYYDSNSTCKDRSSSSQTKIETKPLTAKEMVGVFVALVIGAGLSIVAAVIGHFVVLAKKRYAKNEAQNDQSNLSRTNNSMRNRAFEGFAEPIPS
ncbi:glutamate receptor ionotropic, delta-2-like [Tubulanus polymorphus]|uniref:glutamate receptor ionotropic, delta-2-like n=1 Tax=Tubulanus polymorphus TaxID=672921 RepID=UPI003DA48115